MKAINYAEANLTQQSTSISPTTSIKYLGVTLDRRLTFQAHINAINQRARGGIGRCYRLLNWASPMPEKTKKLIYVSAIKPLMLYAAPIWSTAASSHIDNLERAQLKALKLIGRFPRNTLSSFVRNYFNVSTIHDTIKEHTWKFFHWHRRKTALINNI